MISSKKYPFDFLRGLYDAEGSVGSEKNHRIECGMTNQKCIRLAMELLKANGYQPRSYKTKNKGKHKHIYKIVLSSLDDLIKFASEVGFNIRRKQRRLLYLIEALKVKKVTRSLPLFSSSFFKPQTVYTQSEMLVHFLASITGENVDRQGV